MDLNDLRLFTAIVDHGGVSAAARALRTPKSKLSRRLAALEADLGVRLVERTSRRFAVTDTGREVAGHARAALAEAEAIEAAAARLKVEPQGLVRISCPQGADRVFEEALPEFLARYPRLRVQVIVSNRRMDLIEEGVDVAVRVRERLDTDADLQVRLLGRAQAVLAASPALIEAMGAPQAPADLVRFPTLTQSERPGPEHWTLVRDDGAEESVAHEPRLSSGAFSILRYAAIAGVGIAFLPEYVAREPLIDGRLVRVLPAWAGREGILHLVFASRRGMLPGVRAVIDLAAAVLDPKTLAFRAEA